MIDLEAYRERVVKLAQVSGDLAELGDQPVAAAVTHAGAVVATGLVAVLERLDALLAKEPTAVVARRECGLR